MGRWEGPFDQPFVLFSSLTWLPLLCFFSGLTGRGQSFFSRLEPSLVASALAGQAVSQVIWAPVFPQT